VTETIGIPASQDAADADTVKAVAQAVANVHGVVRLGGDGVGDVATYLPGERVVGVRLKNVDTDEESVEVHVVVDYGPPLPALADDVRTAVTRVLPGRPVDVVVSDVLLPSD
jgi:uncharacterized alkaline shock family protein YloU